MKISDMLFYVICVVSLTVINGVSFAVDPIPSSSQAGRIEQEFKALRVPKSNAKAFVPGQRDLIAPEGAENVVFTLNKINFDGVSALDINALNDEFRAFINKKASLVDLYEIANRTTSIYRNMGFVLSQAVVPEQDIDEKGVVTIQVVEGYVNKINVQGIEDDQKRKRVLKVANKISQSRPLNARDLERYLLILNDFGGVDFSATLSPSDQFGAADILLSVSKDNSSASITLENRGTTSIGPERLTGQFSWNDVIGQYDTNSITVISTGNDELAYVSIQNKMPIGDDGLSVSSSISNSSSKPGGDLEVLEIENDSTTVALTAEYPLIRSRVKNLILRGGLDFYDSESIRFVSAEGSESLSTEDKLRSLRLGMTFDNIDQYRGINLFDVEVSKGLSILSASEAGDMGLSRELGDPEYTKVGLYVARLQSIAPNWSALFSINGQYSNDSLLSSEQFGVGGKSFGSGFDSSEIIGDSGIAARLELRHSQSFDHSLLKSLVSYAFIDGGRIERNAISAGQEEKESLSSYGLGVRYRVGSFLSGNLEYALPNNRDVASEGNDDARLFFSLKSGL